MCGLLILLNIVDATTVFYINYDITFVSKHVLAQKCCKYFTPF